MKLTFFAKRVFHPIFFGYFPVLSLFAHNFDQQTLNSLFMPLLILTVLSFGLWIIIKLLIKSWKTSALVTSITILLIFSYGHFLSFLKVYLPEFFIGMGYLWILLLIFIFSCIILFKQKKETVEKFTTIFNIIGIFLIISPIVLISYKQINRMLNDFVFLEKNELGNENFNYTNLPDIYYIITERYGSEEVLKQIYNFDNTEFINYLKDKGFYVANSSANYHFTVTSIASSLNMNYLHKLEQRMGKEATDQYPLVQLIENNRVIRYLKSRGYKYLHFGYEQGGLTTRNQNADYNYDVNKKAPLNVSKFFGILLSQTVYDPLVSLINKLAGKELIPDTLEGRRKRYYNLTQGCCILQN